MCAMGPKWSIFPDQKLFGTNHCYYFHLPMGPFHCANLKKFLQRIQNYDDATFLDPKLSICSKRFFFFENYYYYSHLPISPFRCAKFKKNSSNGSTVMRMFNFWVQNCPFPQMRIFPENLLMSLISFILVYLHAKNQSQILIY